MNGHPDRDQEVADVATAMLPLQLETAAWRQEDADDLADAAAAMADPAPSIPWDEVQARYAGR